MADTSEWSIPSIGAPGRFPLLEPFRYRTWVRVWAATLVSQLGDWMQIFARAALAYRLTGEPSSVGVIYFASYLPQLLLSLWGGVLADRFDRRRLLIGCQVAQMAGALIMGVLVVTDSASLLNISVLSFLIGFAFTLNIPAGQALGPAVVSRRALASAISLWTATGALCRVFGPVLAAALIGPIGLAWIFWINALSFLAVIVAWWLTRIPRQPRLDREVPNLHAIRDAATYVRRNRRVWVPIVTAAFLMSFGIVYQPLTIPFATEVLSDGAVGLGETRAGWLQAAIGLGAALGIVAFSGLGRRHPGATLMGTALAFSGALFALGRTSSFPVAVVVCVVMGAMHYANLTLSMNLVQHDVPEVMRGRVMSIQMLGVIGLVPIASLLSGAIADVIGIPALYTASGALCIAFSLYALRWRHDVSMGVGPQSPETIQAVGVVLEEEG